jgi:hypothetical protein
MDDTYFLLIGGKDDANSTYLALMEVVSVEYLLVHNLDTKRAN